MSSTRKVVNLCAGLCLLAALWGCGGSAESNADAMANFEQKLELTLDGQPVVIALEGMDIYLTEDDKYNERFEIAGEGVMLAGEFPSSVRVDYGDHWDKLVGALITISPKGGEHYREKNSGITLPGLGTVQVTGGQFRVEKFYEGDGSNTPLTGLIEIKIQTPTGEKTLTGKFSVMGSTWG